MLRMLPLLLFSMILFAGPALAGTPERHSGTVASVDLGRRELTVQELGPWTGPGTGREERTITLTPDTQVERLRRSSGPALGGWPGGYVESTLAPEEIHPGDFVTVQVTRRGGRMEAVSIDVVGPGMDRVPDRAE